MIMSQEMIVYRYLLKKTKLMCKKVLLPFHSAYHQYFQQESPLLLSLSSFDCTGYAKPKHLPNLGITDQPVLSTWLQIPRVAGRIIAPKLSKCEHDFSRYERTLKKQNKQGLNDVYSILNSL